jgi:hypothetical protein
MTAGQQVLPRPILHGRIAAIALVATFGAGLLTGLVAPLVRLPAPVARTSAAVDPVTQAAYLAYRAGERAVPVLPAQLGDPVWLAYRAGERGDPAR